MTERLAALLAEPANGDLQWVAGPADVEWDGVAVEATEADLPADRPVHLAVLTSALPALPWQRDALVRRARDRGVRALVVPGAADADDGTRRLAARLGIALLDVARPIQLARACWTLMQARDALTLDQVRRVAQSFRYPARDLTDLLGHLAANLGHGVALVDATGVMHEAGGHLEQRLHAAIDFGPWVDLARVGSDAAASVRVDSHTRTVLRLAIFGDGLGEAQLTSLAVAAEVAMPAVAARILVDEVAAVNDVSASSGLLRDFLDVRGAADRDVGRRMQERGWRTAGYHLGFQMVGRARVEAFSLLRHVVGELTAVGAEARDHVGSCGERLAVVRRGAGPTTDRAVHRRAA